VTNSDDEELGKYHSTHEIHEGNCVTCYNAANTELVTQTKFLTQAEVDVMSQQAKEALEDFEACSDHPYNDSQTGTPLVDILGLKTSSAEIIKKLLAERIEK